MRIETVRYDVPGWGIGKLALAGGRVAHHDPPRPGGEQVTECYLELVERIRAYFVGGRDDFADVELLEPGWTPFQRDLAEALRRVPQGEVVTYGELAALAGRPGAQRAAGSFCSGNLFGLFIPCHRVVASDGIGGYGSLGVEYKRRLLELEGVSL
ncbi:MAG: methylated-DNA--[protein]-cysteine S-methyltransferase [Gaiellaceae bacterium]